MTHEQLVGEVTSFVNVLIQENEKLLDIVKDIKEAIVANEPEKISELVKSESLCLSNIADIEARRARVVRVLALKLGIKFEDLTVSKIAQTSNSDQALQISQAAQRLLEVLSELKKYNLQNKKLVEAHLVYSGFMLENLVAVPQLNNIYGNQGDLVSEDTKSTLNSEI